MRLITGDTVVVIAGKDRGKKGKILRLFPETERVVVEGVHMQKRHTKSRGRNPGGIIDREGTLHMSNVMLVCPQTGKRTRVGYRIDSAGKKERISKKSGTVLGRTVSAKKVTAKKVIAKKN